MDRYGTLYIRRIDYAPGAGALVHYGPKSEFADANLEPKASRTLPIDYLHLTVIYFKCETFLTEVP